MQIAFSTIPDKRRCRARFRNDGRAGSGKAEMSTDQREGSHMRDLFVSACAASSFLAATALVPVSAVAQEADTTAVLQTGLAGEAGTEANIVVFDVEPGWETQRHIHPGHVFVYVTEGTIEVNVEGEDLRTVSAGEAFYELPDKPMVARTASADEGARFTVFQIGPAGEPIMVSQSE